MKVLINRRRISPAPARIFSRLVSEREGWVRAEKKELSWRASQLARSGADSGDRQPYKCWTRRSTFIGSGAGIGHDEGPNGSIPMGLIS